MEGKRVHTAFRHGYSKKSAKSKASHALLKVLVQLTSKNDKTSFSDTKPSQQPPKKSNEVENYIGELQLSVPLCTFKMYLQNLKKTSNITHFTFTQELCQKHHWSLPVHQEEDRGQIHICACQLSIPLSAWEGEITINVEGEPFPYSHFPFL